MRYGTDTELLGDQHLGKRFRRGVPLDRRGDREATQWEDFERSLEAGLISKFHVNMGDIFDETVVPFGVVLRAAKAYISAAEAAPECQFVVIRGNHDASKDLDRVSAFGLFAAILDNGPSNIHVLNDDVLRLDDYVFIPWHPVYEAAEMVERNAGRITGSTTAFGHWDVVAISDTSNLLPAKALRDLGVEQAVTGHDHNARELILDEMPVLVTGSMQPYSHSEDAEGELYVTLSPQEVLEQADRLKYKCVRVELLPGEIFDQMIDCYQLTTVVRGQEGTEDDLDASVEFEEFDFGRLLSQACEEADLKDADFISLLKTRIDDERSREG